MGSFWKQRIDLKGILVHNAPFFVCGEKWKV